MFTVSSKQKLTKFLNLSYDDFDQKGESGWRLNAEQEKYDKAAEIIIFYAQNKKGLDDIQTANLYFHAGQMFAFANANDKAIIYFEQAKLAVEQEDAPVRWNDYVFSTIAFLQKNKETLVHYRNEIATKGKEIQGVIPNLSIVDNMIAHRELSYAEVYQMPTISPPRQGVNL